MPRTMRTDVIRQNTGGKTGLYGATPAAQPSGAAQAAAAAQTQDALTNSTGATPDTTIADVSTAVTGVDGAANNAASKADVDTRLGAINGNFSDLAAQLAKVKADVAAVRTLANQIRADLVTLGAIKGSA